MLISIQSHRTDSCCLCFFMGMQGASILKFILKLNCTHRMLNSKTKPHQKSVYTWTLHTLTRTRTRTHKDKKSSTFYFMYTVQSTVSLYKSNSHVAPFFSTFSQYRQRVKPIPSHPNFTGLQNISN